MADSKISALTELTTAAEADMLAIVDTTANPDETKRITRANLLKVEDTPTDGHTTNPVSSNALYDHTHMTLIKAYASAQNIAETTNLQIALTEEFDLTGEFANNKFTAANTGHYLISWAVTITGQTAGTVLVSWLGKNTTSAWDSTLGAIQVQASGTSQVCSAGSVIISLTATDYISLMAYKDEPSGSNNRVVIASAAETYLCVMRLD
jgi:hypothetical protein